MTQRFKTVTNHLLEAQAVLDKEHVGPPELQNVRDCLERALDVIQLARAEAAAALDKF